MGELPEGWLTDSSMDLAKSKNDAKNRRWSDYASVHSNRPPLERERSLQRLRRGVGLHPAPTTSRTGSGEGQVGSEK